MKRSENGICRTGILNSVQRRQNADLTRLENCGIATYSTANLHKCSSIFPFYLKIRVKCSLFKFLLNKIVIYKFFSIKYQS